MVAAASAVIPEDVLALLETLLTVDDPALTSFLQSHAALLIPIVTSSLQQIASSVLSLPYLSVRERDSATTPARTLVLLITRCIALDSGPSDLLKALQQPSALVDLSLTSTCLQDVAASKAVLRLFRQLATPAATQKVVESVREVLEEASHPKSDEVELRKLGRAARLLASTTPLLIASEALDGIVTLATTLRRAYDTSRPQKNTARSGSSASHFSPGQLHARAEILEAASALLRVASSTSGFEMSSATSQDYVSKILLSLAPSGAHTSVPPYVPLVDLDLLADLVLVRPNLLPASSGGAATKVLQEARSNAMSAVLSLDLDPSLPKPHFIGPAWAALRTSSAAAAPYIDGPADEFGNAGLDGMASRGKGKASETTPNSQVDPAILETVLAVLPHLAEEAGGVDTLQARLSRPVFAGMGADEVVQALLDGMGQSDDAPSSNGLAHDLPASNEQRPTRSSGRSNIFDEQPLDLSRVRWGTDKTRSAAHAHAPIDAELPSSLKAAVLERVMAQEAEEAAENGREWDPFDDDATEAQEVGFEEELEEPTGVHRRSGLALLAGPRGDSRQWREDASDEDDEEDDAPGARGAPPLQSIAPASGPSSSAAAERAAERILVRAWSTSGESIFARDSKTRKSAGRRSLLAELASQAGGGKVWDDHFVESWASMFARNPRKEALLSSASDLLMPNPNVRPADGTGVGGGETQRYGPDKGRGGRVLGGGRGGGRGGGPTGGGSNGAGGSANGGGAQQGHSGNNRDARRKEQRGNVARQRGFDRKAARGAAGAGGL